MSRFEYGIELDLLVWIGKAKFGEKIRSPGDVKSPV